MNKALLKEHALECSKVCKLGKFKRVGADFIEEVEADVEAIFRELERKCPVQWPTTVEVPEGKHLLDLSDRTRLHEIFTNLVARIIQRKTERQPSCGQTLSRTR